MIEFLNLDNRVKITTKASKIISLVNENDKNFHIMLDGQIMYLISKNTYEEIKKLLT